MQERRRLSPNVLAVILFALVAALFGWIEIARPGGTDFSDLTGGMVTMDTMIRIAILSIVVVGLNLLMGYAGQISLGQTAFYAIGAYTSAMLTVKFSLLAIPAEIAKSWWWPWLALLVGMLIAGAVAYLVGRPILTLRSHYLAMATLGLGIIVYIIFRENFGFPGDSITGSYDGLAGVPRLRIGEFTFWPLERYYFLVWAAALSSIVVALNIVNSRVGRAFRALHGSEQASMAVGVDIAKLKLQALVVSAAYASLGGSLYAHFQSTVSPKPFDFSGALELVVMSAVGGMASIWGAPVGVALILIIKELLRAGLHRVVPGAGGQHEIVLYGVLLILIMIFMPDGMFVTLQRRLKRMGARSRADVPAAEGLPS